MTAVGDRKTNRWHLQIAERWVVQYTFSVHDRRWGRMFVRMCPYLPFSARVDPFGGTVFVFRSKRADRVKMLVYDAPAWC